MTEARLLRLDAPSEYVEIDGRYIRIGERLQSLVNLLADGCSEIELLHEVDVIRPGQGYKADQLQEFIDQLFLVHGLGIDESWRDSYSIWRLHAKLLPHGAASLESAIRCRITIVPESLANKVARALRFVYKPIGVVVAMLLCVFSIAQYLCRFGLSSLSPAVIFRSLHEASMLTVFASISAIILAAFLHEFGHCTAVAAFGLRVRRIGLGIYWLSPALFSDVSAAWTLTRWERVGVDCGGIYFQVIACSLYALAVVLIRSSALQLSLRLAIVANVIAICSSLNPIMKCDGYWMISDAMRLPNLRRQSEKALRDLARGLMSRRRVQAAGEDRSQPFLIGYGLVSLIFSVSMLFLLAMVISHNAAEAISFPKEVWLVLWSKTGTRRAGSEWIRLAADLFKAVPVACAPIAFVTAASALSGFVSRTFSKAE